MMQPSCQPQPQRRNAQGHRHCLSAALFALRLMLAALAFVFVTGSAVQAQEPTGTPDFGGVRYDPYPHPLSRGALAYSIADRWDTTDLTYYFHNCPRTIDCDTGQNAVREGFRSWASISPLAFTEVSRARDADIEMEWTVNAPDVGYVGDVLAFATFPSDGGDIVFDDAEPWSAFDGSQFDLYMVATHEIGHALGIDHSAVPTALMYPMLTAYTTGLTTDDQAAIQALYGTPEDDRPAEEPRDIPPSDVDDVVVSGSVTDSIPYEIWEFDAFAGETLTITVETTSGDLVPYVGLLTGDEEQVLAENGASSGSDAAQITYTFDEDGTYVVLATREGVDEGFTTGDYLLRIEQAEAGAQPAPSDSDGSVLVDVRSYSTLDICEFYMSISTDENWGENRLSDTLTNGNLLELQFLPGTYDALVVYCDGTELELFEIPVERDLALEIYEGEINVFIYED